MIGLAYSDIQPHNSLLLPVTKQLKIYNYLSQTSICTLIYNFSDKLNFIVSACTYISCALEEMFGKNKYFDE